MSKIVPVPSEQIAHAEKLYGITLTERERDLLTWSDALYTSLDQQRRHILLQELKLCRCPACHGIICQRSTAQDDPDSGAMRPDDAHKCPHCGAGLTWHLQVTGDQYFTITPGQQVTVEPAASAS